MRRIGNLWIFLGSFTSPFVVRSCVICFLLLHGTCPAETQTADGIPPAVTQLDTKCLNVTATIVTWKPPKTGTWSYRISCNKTYAWERTSLCPYGCGVVVSYPAVTFETSDTSGVLASLAPGWCYKVSVVTIGGRAGDASGALYQSNPVEKNFTQCPMQPRNLRATSVGSNTAGFEWERSANPKKDRDMINDFKVALDPPGPSCFYQNLAFPGDPESASCSILKPETSYTVSVASLASCAGLFSDLGGPKVTAKSVESIQIKITTLPEPRDPLELLKTTRSAAPTSFAKPTPTSSEDLTPEEEAAIADEIAAEIAALKAKWARTTSDPYDRFMRSGASRSSGTLMTVGQLVQRTLLPVFGVICFTVPLVLW